MAKQHEPCVRRQAGLQLAREEPVASVGAPAVFQSKSSAPRLRNSSPKSAAGDAPGPGAKNASASSSSRVSIGSGSKGHAPWSSAASHSAGLLSLTRLIARAASGPSRLSRRCFSNCLSSLRRRLFCAARFAAWRANRGVLASPSPSHTRVPSLSALSKPVAVLISSRGLTESRAPAAPPMVFAGLFRAAPLSTTTGFNAGVGATRR